MVRFYASEHFSASHNARRQEMSLVKEHSLDPIYSLIENLFDFSVMRLKEVEA